MKDFRKLKIWERGMEIAMGSAFELETQLLILKDLEFAKRADVYNLIDNLHETQPMINSFITKLKMTAHNQQLIANSQKLTTKS